MTGRECGESVCERVQEEEIIMQQTNMSPCCYVEQMQHQRQQYVGFTLARGVMGCMLESNVECSSQTAAVCMHARTHVACRDRAPVHHVLI